MARLTIPDEQTFATFTVVTSTSAFPITFSLFAKADLTVLVDDVALDQSAFSFSGTLLDGGGYDGGTVTLNVAVDDVTVRIERNVTPARASNFAPASTVPVQSIDQALNRLTAQDQDHSRRLGEAETRLDDFDDDVADVAADAAAAEAARAAAVVARSGAETAKTNAETARDEAVAATANKLNLNGSNIAGNAPALRTAIGADLAENVNVDPETEDVVLRSVLEYVREMPLTPQMFGAVADGTLSNAAADTGAMLQMAAYARENKRPMDCPPGLYRLQNNILFDSEVILRGAGAGGGFNEGRDGTVFINDITNDLALSKPLIDFEIPSNRSALAPILEGFKITTVGSFGAGYARKWMGLNWSAVNGTVITNGAVRNILIENHSIGLDINGVLYQCAFDNIRVSGSPVDGSVDGGIPLGPDIAGIRMGIRSNIDITYNSFRLCEVTAVRNGGYGFRGSSNYSDFITITADGPIDISSRGGNAIGVTVEGWTQDIGESPTTYAMGLSGFATISAPTFRGLPGSKFGTDAGEIAIGLFVGGSGATVTGLRTSDGAIPPTPVYNDGVNTFIGCLESGDTVTNKLASTGAGMLNGSVAFNCASLTDFGFGYQTGTWTPTFTDWDTAPTVSAARYTVLGETVHVFINGSGGVTADYDTIGGLPFTPSSDIGGTASIVPETSSKGGFGRIVGGSATINGLRAMTLTGEFWQLHGTYLKAP